MAKRRSSNPKPQPVKRRASTQGGRRRSSVASPVMAVTRFEQVSSLMISIVIGLVFATIVTFALWLSTVEAEEVGPAEMEMIELAGGVDDGNPDETLKVESPEEEIEDPALTEEETDETEIEEVFENVVELSDNAAEQVEQQFETQAQNSGKVGSKAGTGSRPLGSGPGEGGIPRHQRWFIRFAQGSSLTEYAKQLDFFGIELGALFAAQKRLVYVKNFSSKPVRRNVMTGANEKRLYMNWQSGSLRKTDHQLFKRAGINTQGAMVLHFYPSSTENMLAKLEKEFRNRNVKTIRRTIFSVRKRGKGYRFLVTRQTYLR
ncbi:MAG: hypothetical protein MK004_11795 [Planctomycetales bacterium]|nr:hypothetical protein [Planctomycetales bacterium]